MTQKILLFDIENLHRPEHIFNSGKPGRFRPRPAGFCSDLAYILVFGYKWLGDDGAQSLTVAKKEFKADPFDDSPILEAAYNIMMQADVVVTWYGKGHDFPFLTSRLVQKGLYLDTSIKHIDLYQVANKKLRLSSNRLDNVSKFFGQEPKMKIGAKTWADCWAGNYDALQLMAEYCRQDVEVLEQVYYKLAPLGIGLPEYKTDVPTCPTCNNATLIGNGIRTTVNRKYRRLRCTTCGSHTKGELL